MNIFSEDGTIISDVINRILNSSEIKELYVFGEPKGELEWLYPAIHVITGNSQADMKGSVVYIHIMSREHFAQTLLWIAEEKKTRDFIVYVPSDIEISGEDTKILGAPHYVHKYSNLDGVLFLTGISFQRPCELAVPDDFKVLAVIHFYNEADILAQTIQYLLTQGIDLFLVDNWSDDGSYEIAQECQKANPKRIYLEHFPSSGKSDNYEWYHQLERTEAVSRELDYDWYIHYDTDEMRVSPWENMTLLEAIYWIDRQGYNCIENTVVDFRFTRQDSGNIFMEDTFFDFRHRKKMFDQLKTWKKSQQIDLKSSGGHFVHIENPKIYPLKFLNRHYPLRSMEQAEKKVFRDRLPRFQKEHRERGWHCHYNRFKNAEDFIFEQSRLLCWKENTFHELYIPLFLECGIRWDAEGDAAGTELPDIENQGIILYGAGAVGKKLYPELAKKNRIVAWTDRQYERLPMMFCEKVIPLQEAVMADYDYIVLAVKKGALAQEISEDLTRTYHVPEKKILYIKTLDWLQG